MKRALLPLVVFVALALLLGVGLQRNPREVPSPLVNKVAPAFSLPQLHQPDQALGPQALRGQVWLLNVWASWCTSCRLEHDVLLGLARSAQVPIYGLNYKDKREDALAWLTRFGDPYQASVFDPQGLVGLDYGVYGTPETFVIDQQGVIRHKQVGPLTVEVLEQTILPLVRRLRA